ncbi:DNA repair exonuclease [Actinokineospora sp. NBRC 105648]|uniref:metallophosphoesterase family protein n=1 Tax=Actinokineospora sp. NBRC 105648 TaxID=3032206 RepID=UPI0025533411|nr:DNA repair exonuclease [Actinokineospora sp. NBRC 105648]
MPRIVHAADIHLDSQLTGITRYAGRETADRLVSASRRALENLVSLAVEREADAVVLAGDIYDGDWRDYATGRFFQEQMSRLHDEDIRVVVAAGNHDAESVISRSVRLPDSVTILDADRAQTVLWEDRGMAVHGQSFAKRAVTENLVVAYPDRVGGLANVGVLHTAVEGAEGHDTYAPCKPGDLSANRYEYFALGHVHARRIVNDGQWVAAFPGNLQGRHIRETGPKGALVVDIEPGGRARPEFVPLDVARWASLQVDVTGRESFDDAIETVDQALADAAAAAGTRLLVARVTTVGATTAAAELADSERLRDAVVDAAAKWSVTVEKTGSKASVPSADTSVDPDLLTAIQHAGRDLAADPAAIEEFVRPLRAEVGRVLRKRGVDLGSPEHHTRLVEDAVASLLVRLSGGGA